ncbi:MAG: hypothetical protein ACYC1B_07025 [Thermoleophilia bacterium]
MPAAYMLLTVVMLFPMVRYLRSFIIGGAEDGPIGYWSIWWFKYALVDLGQNPFWTDYMFYPDGASLVFHSMPKAMALLGIPLQGLFSLPVAYNSIIFATFVGTGLTTYLLAYKITGARLPAFMAGAFFAFAPFRMGHLSHLNLLNTALIPLFILMVLNGKEALERDEHKGWLYFTIAGVLLGLIAYDTEHYAIYLLLFCVVMLLYYLPWRRPADRFERWLDLTLGIGIVLVVAAAIFSPVLVSAASEIRRVGDYVSYPEWKTIQYYSAGPLSFFRPYDGSWLLSTLAPKKEVTSIGWVVLLFAALGFWRHRGDSQVRFWAVVAIVFLLLSLGPMIVFHGQQTSIPGPQKLLEQIPFIGSPRVPARNIVMTALAASVLAGLGIKSLFERLIGTRWAEKAVAIAAITILALFALEVHPAPRMTSARVHPVYEEIARSPLEGTLITLPLGWEAAPAGVFGMERTYHLMNQPFHERKLMMGMVSRAPQDTVLSYRGEAVAYFLCDPVDKVPRDIDLLPEAIDFELARYDPAFLVINKRSPEVYVGGDFQRWQEFTAADLATLDRYCTEFLGMEKFIEDEEMVAYRRSG